MSPIAAFSPYLLKVSESQAGSVEISTSSRLSEAMLTELRHASIREHNDFYTLEDAELAFTTQPLTSLSLNLLFAIRKVHISIAYTDTDDHICS